MNTTLIYEAIKKATEELSTEAQKIGTKLYEAAQKEQQAKAEADKSAGGETPKEGEAPKEEVKDAETEKK